MTGRRVGAVIVINSLCLRRNQFANFALKHRLPAIHGLKDYP